jgi:ribonuclease E
MAKRMLIDAAHPEETRVVVTSGTRLEEFDFESSTKKQVKGNIYLAKVTRVEPSLQATFVDYGGNRHGFLAFSEIHPDYYRIPVSDRRPGDIDPEAGDEPAPGNGGEDTGVPLAAALPEPVRVPEPAAGEDDSSGGDRAAETPEPVRYFDPGDSGGPLAGEPAADRVEALPLEPPPEDAHDPRSAHPGDSRGAAIAAAERDDENRAWADWSPAPTNSWEAPIQEPEIPEPETIALRAAEESLLTVDVGELAEIERDHASDFAGLHGEEPHGEEMGGAETQVVQRESVETFGGDEVEEVEEADAERRRSQPSRHYRIQEVVKRRQIMLVQVAKEERGNKGAALTTYLSLAGRYCVLMPNTGRGGGVSRKIVSLADRRRLKEILEDLDIPEGMGVIVRTAGAERSKAEIKRDYEYLLRLWNEIRDLTLKSTAPALIYEEGNLIKRSIRDLYTRDIDEVLVEGEEGYKTAKAFMRTLMPSHAKRVQPHRDPQIGLFHRYQIESQIDAIHSPVAQLRSGGYLVINQTEALVAIDVNSGRSTRERNIEETALRTNLEAADEIARQLRLRDLAGLIVIDFIDMEEHRNQGAVERRLKEALKNDRARIQVGRISPFGLLEMSRQRLRPSLAEASTQPCLHCGGTGFIRSVESTALYVLRSIEEEGIRRRSAEICIYVPTNVALYILNQKRESLTEIEARYGLHVMIAQDDTLIPPNFRLERLRAYGMGEAPPLRAIQAPTLADDDDEEDEETVETPAAASEALAEPESEEDRSRRRRRRRRRRTEEPREARPAASTPTVSEPGETAEAGAVAEGAVDGVAGNPPREADDGERDAEAERRRRRRGRRGGRARPRREETVEADISGPAVATETITIVATGEDEFVPREAETMPAPEPWQPWPEAAGIAAASLAPLAGESVQAQSEPEPTVDAPEFAVLPTAEPEPEFAVLPTAETEEGIPYTSEAERVLEEAAATHPVTHQAGHGSEPPPAPWPSPAGEAGIPYTGEHERVLEEAVTEAPVAHQVAHRDEAPPAAPSPPIEDDVRAVTEKPANPRRGWWQRLTQS